MKLTAKETTLMTAIAKGDLSFFDSGVEVGSGSWTECMTEELAGTAVSDSKRGAATVIASLGRKGFLITDDGGDSEDGPWTELTEAGSEWCKAYYSEGAFAEEEAAEEVVLFKISHANEDGVEWEQCSFPDGSYTRRRRRQVSGAWRTDFWGTTASGKRVAILSRDAKAAREAGTFSA